jgi:hypothetical protein
MSDDELLTLGKGWVATEAPSSPESTTGMQIVKQLATKGNSPANLVLGLWSKDPSLRGVISPKRKP